MTGSSETPIDRILHDLQERAKELNCLYRVDELIGREDSPIDDVLREIVQAIPAGWQFPDVTLARLTVGGRVYQVPGFEPTQWVMSALLESRGEELGHVDVYYTEPMPRADEGPFLKEERKLLDAIAERLAHFISRRRLQRTLRPPATAGGTAPEWWVIIDFLRQTDRTLLTRLGRRMINYLCWNGVDEAEALLRATGPGPAPGDEAGAEENRPRPRSWSVTGLEATEDAFRIAGEHLSESEILSCVQGWIKEDKAAYLKNALERLDTPLSDLVEALQRFRHGGVEEHELSVATRMVLRAALVRRFLGDQLDFVNTAKEHLEVADFHELTQRIVYVPRSHGRIGGKAAGLFLAARIVARATEYKDLLGDVRVPRSFYVPSDGILEFIHHNDLDDVYNRKYDEPDRIRLDYANVVQLFKNSFFPPEMLRGFASVLDELEGRPIIVRSSSLLEDRLGAAFSGKYKSLFLANSGSRAERLASLTDAVAEVYASVFGPDPIEYRAHHGLLDLHEEMGILVQEVVGTRVGPYWLPAFAGVGFSNNEFRWSPRIRREDGLLRLVPGLGTRAVDRLADDYPVLISPGQTGLRVSQTAEEARWYSPRNVDVINLERGGFETVDVHSFLGRYGDRMPLVRQIVSVLDHDRLRRPGPLTDLGQEPLVVTFDGLVAAAPFVPRLHALLQLLREKLKTPVDIEFACDGRDLYLLQCRPQGQARGAAPAAIPSSLPTDRVLFSAIRYVPNGDVFPLSHVVYVDPEAWGRLPSDRMREVGRAVGRLNRLLPRRQFILMGPGRWGSRGDIRLGVPVTYADISNTALLVEIARRKGRYVPDLSFGTHFFQDLVESSIPYLPLYPDDPQVAFNTSFFEGAPTDLPELLPDYAELAGVLRVIDVARATGGHVLRVLMNADLEQAVAILEEPSALPRPSARPREG